MRKFISAIDLKRLLAELAFRTPIFAKLLLYFPEYLRITVKPFILHIFYGVVIALLSFAAFRWYLLGETALDERQTLQVQVEMLRLQTEADEAFIAGAGNTAFSLYNRLATSEPHGIEADSLLARRRSTDILWQRRLRALDTLASLRAERLALLVLIQKQQREMRKYGIIRDSLRIYAARERGYAERIALLEQQLADAGRALEQRFIATLRFRSAKDNEQIIYIGNTVNNNAEGYGVGMWESGSVYEGEWHNNKRHGKGVHKWKDGVRYEGEFLNDFRNGMGTYIWKNGDKYIGEWKDGKRHGTGTVYDKNGTVKVIGVWEQDRLMERKPMPSSQAPASQEHNEEQ